MDLILILVSRQHDARDTSTSEETEQDGKSWILLSFGSTAQESMVGAHGHLLIWAGHAGDDFILFRYIVLLVVPRFCYEANS